MAGGKEAAYGLKSDPGGLELSVVWAVNAQGTESPSVSHPRERPVCGNVSHSLSPAQAPVLLCTLHGCLFPPSLR